MSDSLLVFDGRCWGANPSVKVKKHNQRRNERCLRQIFHEILRFCIDMNTSNLIRMPFEARNFARFCKV